MYSMEKNTYTCDFCGFEEESLGATDPVHGSMWECEDCGVSFCEKCFTDKWGRIGWEDMLHMSSGVMCPDCYGEAVKNVEELWELFTDVPMDPATECMEEPFLFFPAGTPREEIWHWFDEQYPWGVVRLLYGMGERKEAD